MYIGHAIEHAFKALSISNYVNPQRRVPGFRRVWRPIVEPFMAWHSGQIRKVRFWGPWACVKQI